MILENYENIVKGIAVRQNLSQLRQEIKEPNNKIALEYRLGGHYEVFEKLLHHEDAKIRKNAALLLGTFARKELLSSLYEAYQREETLFVKSSYLTSMKEFDFREYLPVLKKRLQELLSQAMVEEEKKHKKEEIRVLSDMLIMIEGSNTHKFTGKHVTSELLLLMNRNFIQTTYEQIQESNKKAFNVGIVLKTDVIEKILLIRTYEELLFLVDGMKTCSMNPQEAARQIVNSSFLAFLKERHEGSEPFYFRLECKSRMPLDKKSAFAKRLSAEIEELSHRSLINSTSNYEFEIRLIENKSGNWKVMVKLYTLPDIRFSYRREVVSESIRPVNAALTVALAKPYLQEDARVLDPFCGVGTMLIERHKQIRANTMYGIDIFDEAIKKAKVNTDCAHQIIHYINKDFFEFTHEYLFDEIITNMPMVIGKRTKNDIYEVYRRFFEKVAQHLETERTVVLYSHNREMIQELAPQNGFCIVKEWEISKHEGSYVVVLQ